MNVLVINGSPKGERSNTWKLTQAFLRGMEKHTEGKRPFSGWAFLERRGRQVASIVC